MTVTYCSQAQAILDYLRQGGRLTPLEALEIFGCNRLAARVWDLRQSGHDIADRFVATRSGKRVKEYYIDATV